MRKRLLNFLIKFGKKLLNLLINLGYITGGLISLYGLFIIGEQIIKWLNNEVWIEKPLIEILPKDNEFYSWLIYPHSWYGLNKIIYWVFDTIPLSLFYIIVGFIILFIFTNIYKEKDIKNEK